LCAFTKQSTGRHVAAQGDRVKAARVIYV